MDPSAGRLGACELLLLGGGAGSSGSGGSSSGSSAAGDQLGGLEAALVQLGAREVLVNKVCVCVYWVCVWPGVWGFRGVRV